jgi:hypothetical protein
LDVAHISSHSYTNLTSRKLTFAQYHTQSPEPRWREFATRALFTINVHGSVSCFTGFLYSIITARPASPDFSRRPK